MDDLTKIISTIRYKRNACLFDSIGKCQYAHIKGEALSVLAYGKEGMRKSNDIDILVSRKDIGAIEQILLKNDYHSNQNRSDRVVLASQSHQIAPYVKKFGQVELNIDINFDIFWGEYSGKRIDISEFISDTVELEIYGIKVKTLPPIKSLIQLILHHYRDMNSIFLLATRNSIRYDMFKDVYHLLKNNIDTITLAQLYSMSARYEIIPYVFYVLYYTGQVFEDETVKQYVEAFRTPEGEKIINCYGLCKKEQKEWKFDFKTRLESNNLYALIQKDLSKEDEEKIAINKRIFLGESK